MSVILRNKSGYADDSLMILNGSLSKWPVLENEGRNQRAPDQALPRRNTGAGQDQIFLGVNRVHSYLPLAACRLRMAISGRERAVARKLNERRLHFA